MYMSHLMLTTILENTSRESDRPKNKRAENKQKDLLFLNDRTGKIQMQQTYNLVNQNFWNI